MNREHGLRARARVVRGAVAVALATAVSPLVVGSLAVHADMLSGGDVMVGGPNGQIFHYDSNGKLLNVLDTKTETATIEPALEAGMCFDSAHDMYTTNYDASSMTEFDNQGNILHNPWASGFNLRPISCVEDTSGNTYVGSDFPGDLRKISPTETLLNTYHPATNGTNGIDWIDLASDGCTIYYTSAGANIYRYNTCTSTQLSDFTDSITNDCAALKIRAGGDVLVACPDPVVGGPAGVYRFDATGKLIQVYSAASFNQADPYALDLDVDGTSFWVGDEISGAVDKVDVETGRVLVQVQTGLAQMGGLAVVPGPRPAKPPAAASLPAVQDEFVVCGDAPVTGLPSASSTPCVRSLTGVAPQASSQLGQSATITGAANALAASGGVTVAGRGAPPYGSLQVQYLPAGSVSSCASLFWSASNPAPTGGMILGTVTADENGNYASAGALALPATTSTGVAHVCVLQLPPPGSSTPLAQQTVPVTIVTGSGPGSCLEAASAPLSHVSFTNPTAPEGAWWNGDPGANGPTGGVFAKISNYNPYVTKGTGEVTASTMLYTVPPAAQNAVQTAQTGWTKGDLHFPPGTPPQQFAEYVDTTVGVDVFFSGVSGAIPTVQVPGAPSVPPSPPSPPGTVQLANGLGTAVVGDSDYYATLFDPTTNLVNAVGHYAPGEFNFYVDNTLVASIPGTFAPADTRVGTTVAAGTDQMAGGTNNPEHFSDVWAYEHGWHSFDAQTVTSVVTKDVAAYASMTAANPAAGATVNVWDSSCSM